MGISCGECNFFTPYSEDDHGKGRCQRYPPVPVYVAYNEGVDSRWPEVNGNDWCGEFRPPKPMSAEGETLGLELVTKGEVRTMESNGVVAIWNGRAPGPLFAGAIVHVYRPKGGRADKRKTDKK
jgi:hypothetical protein